MKKNARKKKSSNARSFPQEQSDPFSVVSRIEQVAFPGPPTVHYIEHAELIFANGMTKPSCDQDKE